MSLKKIDFLSLVDRIPAIDPDRHVYRTHSAAHEHRRVLAAADAGDDRKLLSRNRADDPVRRLKDNAADVIARYQDPRIGLAEASIVVLASAKLMSGSYPCFFSTFACFSFSWPFMPTSGMMRCRL